MEMMTLYNPRRGYSYLTLHIGKSLTLLTEAKSSSSSLRTFRRVSWVHLTLTGMLTAKSSVYSSAQTFMIVASQRFSPVAPAPLHRPSNLSRSRTLLTRVARLALLPIKQKSPTLRNFIIDSAN
ncbi:hypothetical protein Tco_0673172 [Tanacetum coccineum]